jgi:hypothetical protein
LGSCSSAQEEIEEEKNLAMAGTGNLADAPPRLQEQEEEEEEEERRKSPPLGDF